jgi:hypothetical protein
VGKSFFRPVKAKDLSSFLKALSYALVSPSAEISISGFFIYLPFLVAVVLLLLRRWRAERALLFVVSLVFWTLLQVAGMA